MRYRLEGNRCDACALDFLPTRRVCPQCHSRTLATALFGPEGRVVVTGEDHTPLMGHTGRRTRPFALIQLDPGPVVIAEIVDAPFDEVTGGMRVELVLRKWRRESNGLYQYGYKFRPLDPL
jgi:uncharacterized OB-fold protein